MKGRVTKFMALLAVGASLLSCGESPTPNPGTPSQSPTPDLSSRPPSAVTVTILSPTNGEVVHGSKVHVVVSINGGQIVATTSSDVSPTQGHVHLYLDSQLIYMAYQLSQDVPVKPGTYTLYAEWVAADHFPFNPRDKTTPIFFTVVAS